MSIGYWEFTFFNLGREKYYEKSPLAPDFLY